MAPLPGYALADSITTPDSVVMSRIDAMNPGLVGTPAPQPQPQPAPRKPMILGVSVMAPAPAPHRNGGNAARYEPGPKCDICGADARGGQVTADTTLCPGHVRKAKGN